MKKIKRILLISIFICIISLPVAMVRYMYYKNIADESNQLYSLISAVVSFCDLLIYIYLYFQKGDAVVTKRAWIIVLIIISLLGSLIIVIMNMFLINAINNYNFDKQFAYIKYVKENQMQNQNNENSYEESDTVANMIAKEYKRINYLKENNLITEQEYQKHKEEILSRIGLDSSQIEEDNITDQH